MGQDPSTIRSEIERTREQMGDTVDALAYKTDVKGRAKESVNDRVDSIKSKFTGVSDAAPSTGDVKQAAGVAKQNPLGLAIGSIAVGFLAGMLLPSTRVEDEKIGQMADDVKDQVKQTAQVAVDHGKQAAQDVGQAAVEAARDAGQEHAEAAKEDMRQQVS